MGLNAAQSVGSESVRMSDMSDRFSISVYVNLSCDSPSKQEEAMELKHEVTKSDYIVVYISNYICLMRVCAELQYFFYMYFSVRISI